MPYCERLHLADSLLLSFDAEVTRHELWQGRSGIVLNRTAFYAEAGGQLADRGRLGDRTVVDVQLGQSGEPVHLLDGELLPVGTKVRGEIDARRRRQHMAMHTGQHMLSRALLDVAGAHTVSSRLGETACTIDVRPGSVGEDERIRIEQLVNEVIDDDVLVQAYFPSPEKLAELPLRKPSKVSENVRVVAVGDFDWVPCGGTHCVRSAQVGLICIISVERYKGGQRISFVAGARARELLCRESRYLHSLARELSASALAVPAAVQKLRRELSGQREQVGRLERQLAARMAQDLRAKRADDGRIVASLDGASVPLLRAVVKELTAEPATVCLLAAPADDGTHVVLARHEASSFDCGRFLKRAAAECGGRGGGRPDHAAGRLPADVDWPALVARIPSD